MKYEMGDKLEAVSMQEEKEKKEIEREDGEEDDHVELSDSEEGSNTRQQPWTKQITIRGLVVSILLGIVYSVIVMKLNLTTGLVPNLNVSAALLAFLIIRSWTNILQRAGYVTRPFTKQENTMIQTCAVACYSIAVGGVLINIITSI